MCSFVCWLLSAVAPLVLPGAVVGFSLVSVALLILHTPPLSLSLLHPAHCFPFPAGFLPLVLKVGASSFPLIFNGFVSDFQVFLCCLYYCGFWFLWIFKSGYSYKILILWQKWISSFWFKTIFSFLSFCSSLCICSCVYDFGRCFRLAVSSNFLRTNVLLVKFFETMLLVTALAWSSMQNCSRLSTNLVVHSTYTKVDLFNGRLISTGDGGFATVLGLLKSCE